MLTALVDAQVLERLLSLPGGYETVTRARHDGSLDLLCTQVTVGELAETVDTQARVQRLVTLFAMTRMVQASGFVLDSTSRGVLRFPEAPGDGGASSGHTRRLRDGLLISTARDLRCALVTHSARLRNLARAVDVPLLTAEELLRVLVPPSSAPHPEYEV